jgi:hypothetical protein
MNIKALKTCRFAHPVPSEPQIEIEKDVVLVVGVDIDAQMAASLIACGCGEEVEEKEEATEESKPIDKMTKGELIDFAEEKEIEIDATANKPVILEAIQEALKAE